MVPPPTCARLRWLRPYNAVQDVEPFARQQVADAGDIATNPFDITEAVAQIQRPPPHCQPTASD
jgi:hypothetical protein